MKGDEAPPTPKMEIFGESPLFADAAVGDRMAPAAIAAAAARACRRDTGEAADMVTAEADEVEHVRELPAKGERNERAWKVAKAGAISRGRLRGKSKERNVFGEAGQRQRFW